MAGGTGGPFNRFMLKTFAAVRTRRHLGTRSSGPDGARDGAPALAAGASATLEADGPQPQGTTYVLRRYMMEVYL